MSIYSGFATRFQQQSYDHCIDSLLYVLQKRLIRFYSGQLADQEKFISVVLKLSQQMKKMEKNKYLEPKSSESVNQLVKFMKIYQHNMIAGTKPQPEPTPAPIQIAEPEQVEQSQPQKKKNIFWVQKVLKDQVHQLENAQDSKQISGEQRQKTKIIEKQPQHTSKDKKIIEFRRTNYQSNSIRAVKLKQTSRTNLSRDRDSFSGMKKLDKSRAKSNYLQQKPPIHGSNTLYNEPTQNQDQNDIKVLRKFQNVSNNPNQIKPAATRSEAQDIIKDYIIKMKRHKKNSRSNNKSQMVSKWNDF